MRRLPPAEMTRYLYIARSFKSTYPTVKASNKARAKVQLVGISRHFTGSLEPLSSSVFS